MIEFKEKSFTVEVKTATNPVPVYVETLQNMVDLLQYQNPGEQRENYHMFELLREMLPSEKQARAMYNELMKVKL